MKKFLIAGSLLTLSLLVGCGRTRVEVEATPVPKQEKPKVFEPEEIVYDESLLVTVGTHFTITLNETPPLKWVISYKTDMLTLVDENKRTKSATDQDRRFVFKANKVGTTHVTFSYKDEKSNQLKVYRVAVKAVLVTNKDFVA